MTVCVNHINAGGAGSSMGTAIALANARHYIDLLLARGYTIDQVAPLLHMFPDERHDFFVSIANLRALRRIWARMMKEQYGATTPEAMACRTTVYGHGQEALAEPLNNIPRTAFGTLAYVLGGASYVYLAGYDEAVSTPNENSARVALAHACRSSPTSTALPTPSTRSAAPILSKRSRRRSNGKSSTAWRRSSRSAVRWPRSAPALPGA